MKTKIVRHQTRLIEQSSKRLKVVRGVGIMLAILAVPLAVVEFNIVAGIIGGTGLLCWSCGTALTWWYHG